MRDFEYKKALRGFKPLSRDGMQAMIDAAFEASERERYQELDWAVLYALGIGIDRENLFIDSSSDVVWRLCAYEWQNWKNPTLVRVLTSFGHTRLEFSDEFAAELMDQAYGDPDKLVFVTKHEEQVF